MFVQHAAPSHSLFKRLGATRPFSRHRVMSCACHDASRALSAEHMASTGGNPVFLDTIHCDLGIWKHAVVQHKRRHFTKTLLSFCGDVAGMCLF